MRSVVNAQQMREVDKYMIETLQIPGIVLMENAALGTARLVMDKIEPDSVIHVFCGAGNNGGDGLACARILLAHGYDVYVVILGDLDRLPADAAANYAMFRHFDNRILKMRRIEDLYGWRVPRADLIVDALFGTGLSRDVTGVHEDVINVINKTKAVKVSVDIPSGISADNGRVLGCAVKADYTVTFQYPKVGHYLYPGREHTGALSVVPIGFDDGLEKVVDFQFTVIESDDPDMKMVSRPPDANKGTFGKLLLIAGSRGMAGAAVMSAKAAYAAGAGLVDVGAPQDVIDVMQISEPEAICTVLPDENGRLYGGSRVEIAKAMYKKSALAIGPGLGEGEGIKDIVTDIVDDDTLCRVVDADALNALAGDLHILAHMKGELVFTPHPLEFARLINTEVDGVLEHPVELATAFAKRCGIVLVLKGATTIVADKDGSVTLVAAGTPGMSKGGSGDVLTGVIGGLAAQGFSAHDAAVLGVYYCAIAGEKAAKAKGQYSMTPADTIEELGSAIEITSPDDPDAWKPESIPSSAYRPLAKPVMSSSKSRQLAPPEPEVEYPENYAPSEPVHIESIHATGTVSPEVTLNKDTGEESAQFADNYDEIESQPREVVNTREDLSTNHEARRISEPEITHETEEAHKEPARTEIKASDRLRASARQETRASRVTSRSEESHEPTGAHENMRRSVGESQALASPKTERPLSRAEAARREADSANEMANEVANRLRGTTRDTGKIAEQVANDSPTHETKEQVSSETASQTPVSSQGAARKPVAQSTGQHRSVGQETAAQKAVSQRTGTQRAVSPRIAPAAPLSQGQTSSTRAERKGTGQTIPPVSSARSEAQKKRDDLNAQIQNELSKQGKEKPVTRTRRRIG